MRTLKVPGVEWIVWKKQGPNEIIHDRALKEKLSGKIGWYAWLSK